MAKAAGSWTRATLAVLVVLLSTVACNDGPSSSPGWAGNHHIQHGTAIERDGISAPLLRPAPAREAVGGSTHLVTVEAVDDGGDGGGGEVGGGHPGITQEFREAMAMLESIGQEQGQEQELRGGIHAMGVAQVEGHLGIDAGRAAGVGMESERMASEMGGEGKETETETERGVDGHPAGLDDEDLSNGFEKRRSKKRLAKCVVCCHEGHNKRTCSLLRRMRAEQDTSDSGWMVHVKNVTACKALLAAARSGTCAEAEELVGRDGADVDFSHDGGAGEGPLHCAAARGRTWMVGKLLELGADKNKAARMTGWTPLHLAALNGTPGCVEALLEVGADAGSRDCEGNTPLHLAARDGSQIVMGLLLDAGAFVDPASEEGTTPIMLAAMRGEGGAVLLLANSGADLKKVDVHGYGLRDYAKMDRRNETLTIVSSLMDRSAKQGFGSVPVVLDGNLLASGGMSLKEVIENALLGHGSKMHPIEVMRQISSKGPIILGGLDEDGGGGDGFAQGLDEGGLLPSDDFLKAVGGVDDREVNSDDEVEEGARLATIGDDSYEELVRSCMQVPDETD